MTTLRTPGTPAGEPRRMFPSAGITVSNTRRTLVFDTRSHLPKQPPEGWSVPERQPGLECHDATYIIRTRELVFAVRLWSTQEYDDLVVVEIRGRNGLPTDEQVTGVLRCIRSCDAFVETDHEPATFDDFTRPRSFIAKAYPASPDSWGAFGEPEEFIVVESPDDPAARPSAVADVNNHVPEPLPPHWSDRDIRPQEGRRRLATPHVDVEVWLRRADGDWYLLTVALVPRPRDALVSDAIARKTLAHFRARSAFREYSMGYFPEAPGIRFFGAKAR